VGWQYVSWVDEGRHAYGGGQAVSQLWRRHGGPLPDGRGSVDYGRQVGDLPH
jgi:hypothetical protein